MKRIALLAVSAALAALPARADEGMWTYDNFPAAKVGKKYGFTPDAKWLESARLSSVRLAGGCSGSFVSGDGLVMTNHHCAHGCIEQLSTKDKDFVAQGFWAPTGDAEVKCPEIELNQLTQISEVTKTVAGATKGLSGAEYNAKRKAAMASIEKACAANDDKVRCDVVELYHGGIYALYRYKRFQDVRLVFAPELAIAFFGGDPDNFNFPRYDLDVSFIRAYEDGKPAKTPNHFKWSAAGAKEGDLTFVSGHPGGTDRDLTLAELTFQRDVVQPDLGMYTSEVRGFLTEYMRRGDEQHRTAETDLFGVENSLKVYKGHIEALGDAKLMEDKIAREAALRAKVKQSGALQKEVGGAWDAIAKAVEREREIRTRLVTLEGRTRGFGVGSNSIFRNARALVRSADELPKPNDQRLREYTDSALPQLKQRLFSTAPVHADLEFEGMRFGLIKLRELLGADDPVVKKVLGKRSPEEVARELVDGTRLKDPAVRKQLFEGGKAAVDASQDPAIVLARLVDPDARAVRKIYEDEVDGVTKKNQALISKARFQLEGTSNYPDATFTLRLSYGAVKGFEEQGKQVAPVTRLGGAFERATGREPFKLPDSWLHAEEKKQINESTPFDVATTNDIIGGNSGSPLFNKDLEVVGLIFDGNIHSLGGDYGFDESLNRAIAVESAALLEALDHIYGTKRLVTELKSSSGPAGAGQN